MTTLGPASLAIRYKVVMREKMVTDSLCHDRWWVILDCFNNNNEVAQFHVSYPGAQVFARRYCDDLNFIRDEWHTWGIVEIAIRNPNVASYIAEWEDRALVAERALLIKAKRDRLPVDVITPEKRVQRWLEDARESMKPIDAEEQKAEGSFDMAQTDHTLRPAAQFTVLLDAHTIDGGRVLTDPETVRFIIAAGIEAKGLQEEIDFTLEVVRRYVL